MSDVGDDNFVRYVYRGEEGERIPQRATHIIVREDVTVIRERAFQWHQSIVEVICHDNVEKIERYAFCGCTSLRRVIMPGVKIVQQFAFDGCDLTDVECGNLDIIGEGAFRHCTSLKSINLPSAEIVGEAAFLGCKALKEAKFGSKLERVERMAFCGCTSLKQIIIPLKDGIITHADIFMECTNLKRVDLVEGALHKTIAALYFEDWRNDMREEIESINQILPTVHGGSYYNEEVGDEDAGEKALQIRIWIRSVIREVLYYKDEHQRIMGETTTTLQLLLPHDIVVNNVLSFLELPLHTFELEDLEDGVIGSDWEDWEDEEDNSSGVGSRADGSSEDDEEIDEEE